jgi:hypothetical protein
MQAEARAERIKALFEKIEGGGFECVAGDLTSFTTWAELKSLCIDTTAMDRALIDDVRRAHAREAESASTVSRLRNVCSTAAIRLEGVVTKLKWCSRSLQGTQHVLKDTATEVDNIRQGLLFF